MESGVVTFPGVPCFSLFRCVDLMERMEEKSAEKATTWRHSIFGLMEAWGPERDDLVTTSDSRSATSRAGDIY
jgi:hypothetical protein